MQFFSRDNGTDFPTYFNPQRVSQEGREFRSFSLGNAFVAPPRVAYDLCWSRNYTKWLKKQLKAIEAGRSDGGFEDFQFLLGTFMMEGRGERPRAVTRSCVR